MGLNNFSDGSIKNRAALGDITNRVAKRGCLLLSGNSTLKSGDGSGGNVANKEDPLQFPKKMCLDFENSEKMKSIAKCVLEDKNSGKSACVLPHSYSEINSLRENFVPKTSNVPSATKDGPLLDGGNVMAKISNATGETKDGPLLDSGNSAPKEGFASSTKSFDKDHSVQGEKCDSEGRVSSESTESDIQLHHGPEGVNDAGVENLASFDCSKFPDSQESRCLELEKCVGFKGDGCSNISDGFELIKSCPCSFCTKASYIWLDLNYQDIKGRIAALKKSQKEASILAQKNCRKPGSDKHGLHKSSKLESDLEGQWKSLFLHMEDLFVRETSELETNLLRFKDLRESYKAELESINGMPSGTK